MSRVPSQRGGVYLLVLVTASISMSIGILAVTAAAAQREIQELAIDRERAGVLAESGIQIAIDTVSGNTSWRTMPGGRIVGPLTIDRGQLWVDAADTDGNLNDDTSDPYTLTATATFGQAKQRVAVDVVQTFEPIEALQYPIVAKKGLVNNHKLEMSVGGIDLMVQVDEVDPLSPWSGRSMADIEIPVAAIIREYADRAVLVPIAASKNGKGLDYEELTLSSTTAGSRELGSFERSPLGVYVIDGGGQDIYIRQPQIVGTLIVLNAASVRVHDPKVLRVGPEGNPVLLIQGITELDGLEEGKTDESISDNDDKASGPDFDDEAFDGVQGLIYIDGPVQIRGGMTLHGTLISTDVVDVYSDVFIRRNDAFLEAPPPGFRYGETPKVIAGTWRSVVD